MSDTELKDLIAIRISTNTILWVDKEVPRGYAEEAIAEMNEESTQGLLFAIAPCGRYARNDVYKGDSDD